MGISRRALLAGAAGLGLGAAPSRPPPRAPAPPLVLGALFPLSGDAALLGDEGFRGLALAADASNATGGLSGRKVAFKRADARDPTIAAAAAKALIEKDKVAAIFGTSATPMALSASALAALAGVPYCELTATGAAVTARGLPAVFRSCPEAAAFGDVAVAGVAELLAPLWHRAPATLKVAVLASSVALGQAVAAAQAAACKERGLGIAQTLSYPPGTVDFMPLIRSLKEAAIEVVLHTGFANDVILFYRGMAEADWRPGMIIGSGPSYGLADTRAAAGPALDRTMVADFPPYAIDPHAAPGAAAVASAYQRRYGAEPRSGLSLAAYVGAGFFFAALAKAGGADPVKLRAAILASDVRPETTANGWGADFDARGQNLFARPVLSQWQQGRLVTISPLEFAIALAKPTLAASADAPASATP